MAHISMMDVADDHQAKFCGVWATVRPGLEILKTLIPGVGPIIIGTLLVLGDGVARKVGCVAVAANSNKPAID